MRAILSGEGRIALPSSYIGQDDEKARMTVRAPKDPPSHPAYLSDFEEAALPAIRSLIAGAVSAGWAPDTVTEGLLALDRSHVHALCSSRA
jgi:hypothetical protein